MMIKKIMLLSALPVTAFSGWAQESAPNVMVVSAGRFLQPVSSVLAPASVVTRDDIERWQVKSVAEALTHLPGVDIAQNGGLGQTNSLFIRGTESRHVLLLIDGIRLNSAGISGSSDISQIPLSLVQRIEYVRGARSAVYGSDAIGGVVNIITGREHAGTTIGAEMGSHGYQNDTIATQQTLGNTRITLAGDYTHTKGFDVVANLPDNYGGPRQPDRDGFLSKSLYGALEHRFNDAFSGFVRGYNYDNRTSFDGSLIYDSNYNATGIMDTRQLYTQSWDTGLRYQDGRLSSQLIASYSHSKDYNYDPRIGRYRTGATLDDARQYNLQWGNTLQIAHGTLSAGVDWQKETTQPGTAYLSKGHEARDLGLYATTQQQMGDITLEGAVRGDDISRQGRHTTWQTSAAWQFAKGYRLITSYGTAFKAPNLGQLYSDFYGNSRLSPEESRQWEAGIEGDSGPVTWRISGYRNEIDNLIDANPTTWRYENIGKARIKGVEATASFDTGPVTHQLSYDYLDPRNATTHEVLLRRAKQQVKYALNGRIYQMGWSLTYRYLGERYDRNFNVVTNQKVKLGGVSLWDAALSYPLTSALTVRGRIANLFDKNYETVYGYHTAGREYFLSGSYSF